MVVRDVMKVTPFLEITELFVLEVPAEWRQLTGHLNGGLAGGETEVLQTITAVSPAPDACCSAVRG